MKNLISLSFFTRAISHPRCTSTYLKSSLSKENRSVVDVNAQGLPGTLDSLFTPFSTENTMFAPRAREGVS